MAKPVATAGSDVVVAQADVSASKNVTVGPGSGVDSAGGRDITGYQWKIISKPSGSSAAFQAGTDTTASAVLTSVDTWGNYLLHLTVTDSYGKSSETNHFRSPQSALLVVRVQSTSKSLEKIATGERNWASRLHAVVAAVESNAATVAAPTVTSLSDTTATGAQLNTLTGGGRADGLHSHSGTDLAAATSTTRGGVSLAEEPLSASTPRVVTQARGAFSSSFMTGIVADTQQPSAILEVVSTITSVDFVTFKDVSTDNNTVTSSAVPATATFTFGDTEHNSAAAHNGTIKLIDAAGTAVEYKIQNDGSANAASNEFNTGGSDSATATSFVNLVNSSNGHNGTIVATTSGAQVILTQATGGVAGNTLISYDVTATSGAFQECIEGGTGPTAFASGVDATTSTDATKIAAALTGWNSLVATASGPFVQLLAPAGSTSAWKIQSSLKAIVTPRVSSTTESGPTTIIGDFETGGIGPSTTEPRLVVTAEEDIYITALSGAVSAALYGAASTFELRTMTDSALASKDYSDAGSIIATLSVSASSVANNQKPKSGITHLTAPVLVSAGANLVVRMSAVPARENKNWATVYWRRRF